LTLAEPVYESSADGDNEFKTASTAGTDTGDTVLTFTWFSTDGYTLQYVLIPTGDPLTAAAEWTNAPASGTPTEDLSPSADDDEVWVRFIDEETNYVSAPAQDTGVTLSRKA
jgi:hypothetical protein